MASSKKASVEGYSENRGLMSYSSSEFSETVNSCAKLEGRTHFNELLL